MPTPGQMTFRRYGRSYHLRIQSADDLRRVLELDEAHWVATGAPISTINCDRTFLKLVDSDHNGRIMCFELKDAIRWLLGALSRHDGVAGGSDVLRLADVNTDTPEGGRIVESATKMLARLGKADAGQITLEQVRLVKAQAEATPVSEGGVVLPEAAADPQVKQFLSDIIATVGGAAHPSGSEGVDTEQLGRFLTRARAHLDWLEQARIPAGEKATAIMPLGNRTPRAFGVLGALAGKVDQYFAQCEAVAMDPRVADRIGLTEPDLATLDFDDPAVIAGVLRDAPLARPRADGRLCFSDPLNSHYAAAVADLRTKVVRPALGQAVTELSREQWRQVKDFFAAHEAWVSAKAGPNVEPLGEKKLQTYLDGPFADAAWALIADSARTAFVLDNIRLTEKFILYQANMKALANNFVSFPDLYDVRRRAMFEMGTLIMDGRHFNLSVRAADRAAHSAVARGSSMFVMYVEILAGEGEKVCELAVPVTSGGKGNLTVGKRGIFEGVNGSELDARVVQIIENPISVVEALVSPFKRIGAIVTGKIESLTGKAEKSLDASVAAAPVPGAAPKASGGLMAGGLLMGGGVAVAALGSAVAYFTKTLAGLEWWKILIGVGSAVLAVIIPTCVVAFLKLRRRDLSAILEGSGWALNARMRLTRKQRRFFTRRPRYPRGAKGVRRLW